MGFDQNEVAIMASTAYFHRKSLPAPRFEAFAGLDRASRKVVRRLGAFLRLAEYLDRGHVGAIRHARLRREAGSLLLEIEPRGDWSLEEWSLERRRGEPGEGVRLPHRRGRRAGPGRAGGRRLTPPRAYATEAGA